MIVVELNLRIILVLASSWKEAEKQSAVFLSAVLEVRIEENEVNKCVNLIEFLKNLILQHADRLNNIPVLLTELLFEAFLRNQNFKDFLRRKLTVKLEGEVFVQV